MLQINVVQDYVSDKKLIEAQFCAILLCFALFALVRRYTMQLCEASGNTPVDIDANIIIETSKPERVSIVVRAGLQLHRPYFQSWQQTVCELTRVLPKKFASTAILFNVKYGFYIAIIVIFLSSWLSQKI